MQTYLWDFSAVFIQKTTSTALRVCRTLGVTDCYNNGSATQPISLPFLFAYFLHGYSTIAILAWFLGIYFLFCRRIHTHSTVHYDFGSKYPSTGICLATLNALQISYVEFPESRVGHHFHWTATPSTPSMTWDLKVRHAYYQPSSCVFQFLWADWSWIEVDNSPVYSNQFTLCS